MSWEEWLRGAVLADLPSERRRSYLFFGLALAFALMTFQLISPVKIAVFIDVVGTSQEPVAKSLVPVVLIPLLIAYSVLVSLLSTRGLVVTVCGFYFAVFLMITAVMLIENGQPAPWVAWVLYFATETRGVIIMPMVWSVVADVSTSELSKKAYAFLFFLIQLGGIAGSFCAIQVRSLGGEVGLLLLTCASFPIIGGFTVLACGVLDDGSNEEQLPLSSGLAASGSTSATARNTNTEGCCLPFQPGAAARASRERKTETESQKSAGVVASEALRWGLDGLWLLLSRPYAFMAFWVSYAYLVPRTVLDYEQTVLANAAFTSRDDQVAYFGRINMCCNVLTALVALLGTRELINSCGVDKMLFFLPVVMMLCIVAIATHYSLAMASVTVIVASTVAYGLNQPCKELLFVRTSRDIKFKAKSWSEMYGNQLMKMLGAQINLWINNDVVACRPNCFSSVPTIAITGAWVVVWMFIAFNAGRTYRALDADDKIVS